MSHTSSSQHIVCIRNVVIKRNATFVKNIWKSLCLLNINRNWVCTWSSLACLRLKKSPSSSVSCLYSKQIGPRDLDSGECFTNSSGPYDWIMDHRPMLFVHSRMVCHPSDSPSLLVKHPPPRVAELSEHWSHNAYRLYHVATKLVTLVRSIII